MELQCTVSLGSMVFVMMSMMMSVSETCLHPDICTMEEAADWDTFIATIDCSNSARFEQCITEIVGLCTDGSPERVASEERLQAITAACSSDSPSTQPPPEQTGCFADARECEQIAQQEYPDLRCGKNNYVHNCLLGVLESDSDNCSFSEEDIRHHRISNAMSCFRYIDCHNCDVPDDFPADGSFPELNPATCHRTLTALNCFRGRDFSCAIWLSNQTLGEMLADVHEFCPIVNTDTVTTGDTSGSDHSSISSKSTHLAIIATLILTLANQFPYCLPRQ